MRRRMTFVRTVAGAALVAGTAMAGTPAPGAAQQGASQFLAVGEPAPDFALPGADRYGILRDPVRLSDYRGETVVLAFFFRARTPG
ncbi:MAG: redoxin domain-containing protein [Gemmatimonadota bacterium]